MLLGKMGGWMDGWMLRSLVAKNLQEGESRLI